MAKKINAKLSLSRQTVRHLSATKLARVNGGLGTFHCAGDTEPVSILSCTEYQYSRADDCATNNCPTLGICAA